MQNNRRKTITSLITFCLMLTITVTIIALPAANAHDPPWTIPTYAYVTLSPDTVGVGQYTLVVMYLDKYPATAGGNGGDRWRGFTLDITKPNGDKQTVPYTGETSATGTAFMTYTPDQVGDYTIVFSWPGQTLERGVEPINERGLANVGDYYEGATSEPAILHVQQEPIAEWVEAPLPDLWTRPINSANREWSVLPSNWLGGSWLVGNYQRWGQAPETGHILWTKPILDGGIQDAAWPGEHGQTTDYESMWNLFAVMNGKMYWYEQMYPDYGYYCTDLRTGETIWYKNGTDNGLGQIVGHAIYQGLGGAGVYSGETYMKPSFAQLFHYYSLNGQGVLSHLWATSGSTWYMFDALTGNWILTIEHVPGGTAATDQDGSILRYSYSSRTGNYLCWNVTKSIGPPSPTGTGEQQWEPRQGATIDAVNDTFWYDIGPYYSFLANITADDIQPRSGYSMNVTGPTDLPSLSRVLQDENRVPKMFFHYSHSTTDQEFHVAAVSIDEHAQPYSPWPDKNTAPQQTNLGFGVTKVMDKTFKDPILTGNLTYSLGTVSYEDKVFTIESKETIQKWGFSLETGAMLWGPTAPESSFNVFGQSTYAAYGNLYSTGYAGSLYCYDIQTGNLKWVYNATGIGYESPYGNYPLSLAAICDDKIYLYSTEHSPTAPLWRGSYLRCVNATEGTEIWKVLNFVQDYALADGCFVTGNWYDQQMYVFGKGPSATTVSASPKVSVNGDSVLIEGTVMDMSSGATQDDVALHFPNGLPAVSDEDMSAWMEYVYETQVYPSDAKGVEVTLDTVDPNGNFVHIGTVTSDLNGDFGLAFVPEVPGTYKVIATFAGSGSYGSSYAQTMIQVDEVPQATPEPTPTPASTADLYLMPATASIIVAIAVVGLVIILLLRKR